MTNVHIVTDSGARFSRPHPDSEHLITVVPNLIDIDGTRYREGIDLSAEDALRRVGAASSARVVSPSVVEYAEIFARLSHQYDAIISIHGSRELFGNWHNARLAAEQVSGGCEIVVIDSRNTCAGQGMLVQMAAEAAAAGLPADAIVTTVRNAIERVYSIYYVEATDHLQRHDIMAESHAVLGSMLNVKPFLSIEEGELIIIEKVRTRMQAVERLAEFLVEFEHLEDAVIVQHRQNLTDQSRMLQDRLAVEFPERQFPYMMYGASLATLLGPEATGIVVLEREHEDYFNGEYNND